MALVVNARQPRCAFSPSSAATIDLWISVQSKPVLHYTADALK